MKSIKIALAATFALSALPATSKEVTRQEIASCISVSTAAQLQAINNNLSGSYCITANIDASSIANFDPIGKNDPFFTGRIFGNGHVIRNLTINNTADFFVGMIGVLNGGSVQDLGLINAKVTASNAFYAGAMFGVVQSVAPIRVTNVYSTGQVNNTTLSSVAGGLIGIQFQVLPNMQVTDSWSSAAVTGDGYAGGVIGSLYGSSARVYATGRVVCTAAQCLAAGGAIGFWQTPANGSVIDVFATGQVSAGNGVSAGGLIGWAANPSVVKRGYATGAVTGGTTSNVGSVFGFLNAAVNVTETFGTGHLAAGTGSSLGGHTGKVANGPTITNSYWDTDTTGLATTAGTATGQTTSQLRANLPSGFNAGAWGINKTLSYPFLNTSDQFASTLATLVNANQIFTFLPLQQSDLSLYDGHPTHTDEASLAVVLTMMARGIGWADGSVDLQNTMVSKYWQDSKQKTKLVGELKSHLSPSKLGFKTISNGKHLDSTNVIGPLKTGKLVILKGDYTKSNGKTATHAMLATLYVKTSSNGVRSVVANDPWTGTQVEISPKTKRVITPGFPLTDFKVNQYQAFVID